MSKEAMKLALEAAYLAGFNVSEEGYNGKYPFRDHDSHPEQDVCWMDERAAYIGRAMAKPDFWEGYVPEPDKRQQALDKKAENARELGLDYEPSTGMQVSKVWWDSEKLMAKPIPFVEFYKPAQRTWVSLTDEQMLAIVHYSQLDNARAIEAKLKEMNNG